MLKKAFIGLAALIVLIGVGGFLLWSNLDHLIKVNVEKYGSLATKTNVTLDSVKLALASGQGELDGLSVGNPQGFSSAKSFDLGSITLALDTNSLRGTGPIVIREIVIDKPLVRYELLNNGDSNLSAIQKNTQAYANSFAGQATDQTAAKDTGNAKQPSRKIIIDHLAIRDGQVGIAQEMLKDKDLSVSLPTIDLHGIGRDSGGATAAQIAEQVLGSITNAASQAAITQLAKDKIGGLLKEVPGSAIGGAAVDSVGTQIKGLFGK